MINPQKLLLTAMSFLLGFMLCPAPVMGDTLYSVQSLNVGSPSSGQFTPVAINDLGQIVGNVNQSAAIYYNGTLTPLPVSGAGPFTALDINNSGAVSGFLPAPYPSNSVAAVYMNGQVTSLAPLVGSYDSSALAINNSGQIIGSDYMSSPGGLVNNNYLYSNGAVTSLGSDFQPDALNNSGQIAGGNNFDNAVLYNNGQVKNLGIATGGGISEPTGINDSGEIIGQYTPFGCPAAESPYCLNGFIYQNGQVTQIYPFVNENVSDPLALNNAGQIVGSSQFQQGYGPETAFLYTGGQTEDLNSLIGAGLNTTLVSAFSINSGGQILTEGANGDYYLLNPTSAVPEPNFAVPGAAFLLALGFVARRFSVRRRANTAAAQIPSLRF